MNEKKKKIKKGQDESILFSLQYRFNYNSSYLLGYFLSIDNLIYRDTIYICIYTVYIDTYLIPTHNCANVCAENWVRVLFKQENWSYFSYFLFNFFFSLSWLRKEISKLCVMHIHGKIVFEHPQDINNFTSVSGVFFFLLSSPYFLYNIIRVLNWKRKKKVFVLFYFSVYT